ncbi:MAG: hypothetical protein U1E65_02480 [Myxococcota bacterium]
MGPLKPRRFVAADEVQNRRDGLDRALAIEAQHVGRTQRVIFAGLSLASFGQSGQGQVGLSPIQSVWSSADRIERVRGD